MSSVTRTNLTVMLAAMAFVGSYPVFAFRQNQTTGICTPAAGERPPIIDVHMHAIGAPPDSVITELDAHNVIAVVLSSLTLPRTQDWAARDARFIPSLAFRDASIPLDTVRDLLQRHTVSALGELGFAYAGLRPDDPSLEPYFALAEELDVPVAIHMAGGGLPDVPAFRVRLGDPLLLEEVLVRHPRLRVNVMHAGLPFLEGTLAIMRRYPQVYADLSKISDANAYPREQFHEYLRSLMRAKVGDRLMFGSDAAGPGALGPSVDGITSAAFLSDRQKRAILCENASQFFRLTTRRRR
jgi:predicted TIM-barrel fold metal-dependent hydrolase